MPPGHVASLYVLSPPRVQISRQDFVQFAVSFFAVLCVGIEMGILFAAVVSVCMILYRYVTSPIKVSTVPISQLALCLGNHSSSSDGKAVSSSASTTPTSADTPPPHPASSLSVLVGTSDTTLVVQVHGEVTFINRSRMIKQLDNALVLCQSPSASGPGGSGSSSNYAVRRRVQGTPSKPTVAGHDTDDTDCESASLIPGSSSSSSAVFLDGSYVTYMDVTTCEDLWQCAVSYKRAQVQLLLHGFAPSVRALLDGFANLAAKGAPSSADVFVHTLPAQL